MFSSFSSCGAKSPQNILDEGMSQFGNGKSEEDYHFKNFDEFFDLPLEKVIANRKPRMVITDDFSIFEELLSGMNNVDAHVEGRITVK